MQIMCMQTRHVNVNSKMQVSEEQPKQQRLWAELHFHSDFEELRSNSKNNQLGEWSQNLKKKK